MSLLVELTWIERMKNMTVMKSMEENLSCKLHEMHPAQDHVLVPVPDPEEGPNRGLDPDVDHVQSQGPDRGLEIEDVLIIKDGEGQDPDQNLDHQTQSKL